MYVWFSSYLLQFFQNALSHHHSRLSSDVRKSPAACCPCPNPRGVFSLLPVLPLGDGVTGQGMWSSALRDASDSRIVTSPLPPTWAPARRGGRLCPRGVRAEQGLCLSWACFLLSAESWASMRQRTWAALTLDSSGLGESQAQRLMRLRGDCGGPPKTEQAGSLRPLRDPGPSGLKEKKVSWRPGRESSQETDLGAGCVRHWLPQALSPQYFKVVFSRSAGSHSLGPHGLQHARLLCPGRSVYLNVFLILYSVICCLTIEFWVFLMYFRYKFFIRFMI